MKDRAERFPDIGIDCGVIVGRDVRSGREFFAAHPVKRRLGSKPTHDPETFAQHAPVFVGRQEIVDDLHRVLRVCRPEPYPAPAFRPQVTGAKRVSLLRRWQNTGKPLARGHRHRAKEHLDIGYFQVRAAFNVTGQRGRRGRGHASPEQFHPGDMECQPIETKIAVKLGFAGIAILHAYRRMILQIGTDPRHFMHHLDAHFGQMIARSHAGQHQDLRRIDCAARQNDLLLGANRVNFAILTVFNADGAAVFDQYPVHMGAHLNVDVRALHRGPQIGDCGALAAAIHGIHLQAGETFLGGTVVIRRFLVTGLFHRVEETVEYRILHIRRADFPRPVRTTIGIVPVLKRFRALEIGQHVIEGPAGQTLLAPAVVIAVIAAHISHHIDRGRTAEHLAARVEQPSVVNIGFGFGFIRPVEPGIVPYFADTKRHVDHEALVPVARFQRQHPVGSVGAQPVGQYTAGRPGAHDDVIDCILEFGHRNFPRATARLWGRVLT